MFKGFEIGQIPHLMILGSHIRQSIGDDPEKQRIQEHYLEQLPYSLVASATALLNIAGALSDAPKHIPPFPREGTSAGIVLLPEHIRNVMGFAIDSYFDAARRTQNATCIYISKVFKISIPSSMADTFKDIEKGKICLPDNIKDIIIGYWNKDGLKVKHYRDLVQHHVVVSSDARLVLLPGGGELLYLTLPNNPTEKNPAQLKYIEPTIDAFRYIFSSFMMLYEYVFYITYNLLNYLPVPDHETMSIMFKSPLTVGAKKPEGYPLPNVNNVIEQILKHQGAIKSRVSNKL